MINDRKLTVLRSLRRYWRWLVLASENGFLVFKHQSAPFRVGTKTKSSDTNVNPPKKIYVQTV